MDPESIIYREATPDDWDAINALLTRVSGSSRSRELWNWMLEESPDSRGFSYIALAPSAGTPEVVGLAVSVSRGFHADAVRTICGQSIDAMTRPDWQRNGINRKLNELLVQRNHAASIPYLMGFSNENSTRTVLHYQGRKVVGSFPVLLRPLSLTGILKRLAAGPAEAAESHVAKIPEDADPLWKARGDRMRMGMARDRAYLTWRYRRPGGAYHSVELRDGAKLRGLGVLGLRVQARLRTAFIMDAFVEGDDAKLWKRLVRAMADEARRLRCEAICALAFPDMPERKAYTRSGFLPIPAKLSPEHIVFSLRTTGPEPAANEAWNSSVWRLSWGDTDLV
jgi:GNAT superfamily N-acetyltransferase